ncbi:MAG: cytidylate kinase family protein, partial [Oscillospiraceae bacterium]
MTGISELPLNDRVFLIQSEMIRKVANEGACVIVGRCADYVLKEHPHCLHFFIYSNIEDRVKRATTVYGMEPLKAQEN